MKPAFLVVDKPPGITSHDVVAMVRAVLGVRKVGHTGTLDPFATGALALALGGATRLIRYLDESVKIYEARIALGAETDTGDPTGEVVREAPLPELDEDGVRAVLAGFRGVRMQAPPAHSAVKIRGRPAYYYARRGEDVRPEARPVRVDAVELLDLRRGFLTVRITCGPGTYARVLAVEIGAALGSAGHLAELRRIRTGPFYVDGALTLPELSRAVADRDDWTRVLRRTRGGERVRWLPRDEVRARIAPRLVEPELVLGHLPSVEVPRAVAARLDRGGFALPVPEGVEEGGAWVVHADGRAVAVARRHGDGARLVCNLLADI